jgi:hypothetical protein
MVCLLQYDHKISEFEKDTREIEKDVRVLPEKYVVGINPPSAFQMTYNNS